jgi:hypothetical protein
MSKLLGRMFGGYKATDKLLVLDLDELKGKQVPKCDFIVIEAKRGDKTFRSTKIECKNLKFPAQISDKMAMLSVFYVDEKHKV